MDFKCYLAMTATEFSDQEALPGFPAWMACHYACYGTGLSNLPERLPKGAMLIINDRTPPRGHDPGIIFRQVLEAVEAFQVGCVLLDFQRAGFSENAAVAKQLSKELPCPLGISEAYAQDRAGAVFVGAPLPRETLGERTAKWAGREIWLELATEAETAVVTKDGARFEPMREAFPEKPGFFDETLHCRYHTRVLEDKVEFTLIRDPAALGSLKKEAIDAGIRTFVGLYQQLGSCQL